MSRPRRISFEYPSDIELVWTPQAPEFSYAANAVSLMMPSIEPYFVRSVRAVSGDLAEPLASEVEIYLYQEAQHHKEHVRYNKLLIERYPALARLDSLMRRVFSYLETSRSERFNATFAACAETVAYSAARWAAGRRTELFNGADETATTLFLWHLAEEVEHKAAAFDVYRAIIGSPVSVDERTPTKRSFSDVFKYLLTMIVVLAVIVPMVFVGTATILVAERRILWPISWFRLIGWSVTFAFEMLTNLTLSLSPSHHPHQFVDPFWYEVWLAEFDAESGTLPVWHADYTSTNKPVARTSASC